MTVEYERARGMRERHQTMRGYQVSVTKTLPVPLATLYAAFCRRGESRPMAAGSAHHGAQGTRPRRPLAPHGRTATAGKPAWM